MGLLRGLSGKTLQQAVNWVPSLVGYGGAAGCVLLYFTEWKAVLEYVPFYNQKFKSSEDN